MSATITSAAAVNTDQRDRSTPPTLALPGRAHRRPRRRGGDVRHRHWRPRRGASLRRHRGADPGARLGELTLFFTAIGVVLVAVLRRKARRPQATFVKVTLAVTAPLSGT